MKLVAMIAIFKVGGVEIILMLAIALIPFAGEKLPGLAKDLANGIRKLKKAKENATEETCQAVEPIPGVSRRLPATLR